MKKSIVVASLLVVASLMADVVNVIPNIGYIDYDSSKTKSNKDSAKFGGVYVSMGNLDYLVEMSYSYVDIDYKSYLNTDNLKQNDVTLTYAKYFPTYMLRGGLHYVDNDESGLYKDLGDGYSAIVGISGYKWYSKNKFTYGVDGYYSSYSSAKDENGVNSTISLYQYSPYLSYYQDINTDIKNTIFLKLNYINATDYKDDSYTSVEIMDTLYYKKFYTTVSYRGGEMRTGIEDGGFTLYNTKDLMKTKVTGKIGYYFTPKLKADISYTQNSYEEWDTVTKAYFSEGQNSIIAASLGYTF